ncbi:MAG: hypothetical protein KME16_27075 [Scytolyngbya sp. HA4215-MV1]|nr:hypothetical protein [Scytolyngbya sp. HA4215-MV1]
MIDSALPWALLFLNLSRLPELVEDTQMMVGSEAYAAARLAYSSAKTL